MNEPSHNIVIFGVKVYLEPGKNPHEFTIHVPADAGEKGARTISEIHKALERVNDDGLKSTHDQNPLKLNVKTLGEVIDENDPLFEFSYVEQALTQVKMLIDPLGTNHVMATAPNPCIKTFMIGGEEFDLNHGPAENQFVLVSTKLAPGQKYANVDEIAFALREFLIDKDQHIDVIDDGHPHIIGIVCNNKDSHASNAGLLCGALLQLKHKMDAHLPSNKPTGQVSQIDHMRFEHAMITASTAIDMLLKGKPAPERSSPYFTADPKSLLKGALAVELYNFAITNPVILSPHTVKDKHSFIPKEHLPLDHPAFEPAVELARRFQIEHNITPERSKTQMLAAAYVQHSREINTPEPKRRAI